MEKYYLEEIFVGDTVPEGTIARMEKERQRAYIISKLNVKLNRQKEELIAFLDELLKEALQ